MDKVFNLEIDGQITLPDGSKLGPFYETPINIVQPSSGGWPSDLPKPSVGGYGYTEQGEQVLLFDGDLLIDNSSTTPTGAVVSEINIDSLEVGETYNIVWNGVDYTCECMTVEIDGHEIAYLGNLSITGLSISTDYPFVFVDQQNMYMVATLTAGTYSIKLSKSGETIHKIDEKYLPASGGAIVHYINTQYDESEDSFVNRLVYNPDDANTEFSEQTKEKFLDWKHMKNLVGTTAINKYGNNCIIVFTSKNGREGGSCVIFSPSENITAISSDFIPPR